MRARHLAASVALATLASLGARIVPTAHAQQTTPPDPRPPATKPAPPATTAPGTAPGTPPATGTATAPPPPPPSAPPGATPPPASTPPGAYPSPPPGGYPQPPPGGYPPPPPGYAPYPPPGYAPYPYPPPYGYAPPEAYAPPKPPAELAYEDGMEIPPGYRLESRVRRGPVIAGTILFATTYGINLLIASVSDGNDDDNEIWLYVPGVGTWPYVAENCDRDNEGCEFLVLHSLAHSFGLALLIYGIAAPKSVLVRDSAILVTPARIGSGNGLALHARF